MSYLRCANGPAATQKRERLRASRARRVLHLIEPVESHRFDDAVADHDQARFVLARAEMLMDRERRDVDEIAPRPFGFARLGFPIPLIRIDAVEFEIPVQVVTRAFGDED